MAAGTVAKGKDFENRNGIPTVYLEIAWQEVIMTNTAAVHASWHSFGKL